MLQLEEEHVLRLCNEIIALKPDVVFTEKGVSDLAQHFLLKAGISAIRRVRKSDNNRIARACGAVVVNRTEELRESDVGTKAGLFEIKKMGDEYFTYVTKCKDPKACTILLRGASKDVLNETERNLQDALHVARNLVNIHKLPWNFNVILKFYYFFRCFHQKSSLAVEQLKCKYLAQLQAIFHTLTILRIMLSVVLSVIININIGNLSCTKISFSLTRIYSKTVFNLLNIKIVHYYCLMFL